jgi:hypothetical protein
MTRNQDHLTEEQRAAQAEDQADRAIRAAGMFSSGSADTSTDHDRYLAEAFEE